MPTDDTEKDLLVVLSYLAGRLLKLPELLRALGMSKSTYYDQKERGTLTSIPNLVATAEAFGLNKVDLLVRYGHLSSAEMLDYLESEGAEIVDGSPTLRTTVTPTRKQGRRVRTRARLDIPSL